MATADRPDVGAIDDFDDPDTLVNGVIRPTGPMTEEEFIAWCDEDVKAEWVDGEVIIMSPASYKHVALAGWLIRVLGDFVDDHDLGEILGVEFMVRFEALNRRRVPDVLFIARDRLHLLRPNHFEGPPDLAVEIVSPDSVDRDYRDKVADYQAAGVREYWIVDPWEEVLTVYVAGARRRFRKVATRGGRVPSAVLPGFYLRPEWLWQCPLPNKRAVLRELGLPG